MRIDIWRADQDMATLVPDMEVFTLRLIDSDAGIGLSNILCDVAWSTEAETKEHFWIKHKVGHLPKNSRVEIVRMSLHEYIDAHHREVPAMNPFWAIGRQEFMDRWRSHHQSQLTRGA